MPLIVSLSCTVRSASSLTQPDRRSTAAAATSTERTRARAGAIAATVLRVVRQNWPMQAMTLSDEQHEFRRVLRQFCEDKIAPWAAGGDERAEYSWETFRALQAMELTGLQMPAEYGGVGADLVTQAIAAEELARVDASASLMFLISKLG